MVDKQDSRMSVVKNGADSNNVQFNIRYSSTVSGILQQHSQQQEHGSMNNIGASVTKVIIDRTSVFVPITSKNSASGLNIELFHWETTNFTVSLRKIALHGFEGTY
jgi:hypothetical protein